MDLWQIVALLNIELFGINLNDFLELSFKMPQISKLFGKLTSVLWILLRMKLGLFHCSLKVFILIINFALDLNNWYEKLDSHFLL